MVSYMLILGCGNCDSPVFGGTGGPLPTVRLKIVGKEIFNLQLQALKGIRMSSPPQSWFD